MASKESLKNLSVDDLAMTLDAHLCNQRVDILKIVAILMVTCEKKILKRFTKTYWRMRINQNRIRKHI